MKEQKKKKGSLKKTLSMGAGLVVGMGMGFGMGIFLGSYAARADSLPEVCSNVAVLFAAFYVGMLIQIIVHEAGHLVFGLLSGYRFSSFRIGSFLWYRENGRLRLKRQSIAGTGGQCLMVPPALVDGKIPVVLYNLGGSLMNLLVSALLLVPFFLLGEGSFIGMFCLLTAVCGVISALLNGIPMHMGTIDNDGYNALSLGKSQEAMEAFWLQLTINDQLMQGKRLKDMPEEWFRVPADEAMKNSMVVAVGAAACNRLMDQKRFAEADTLMAHLLEIESGMVDLHRNLLIADRMYCEMLGQNRRDTVDALYTPAVKKFMKSMKNYPSVIRTQYAYALLAEGDAKKAQSLLTRFEKVAKTYPSPGDIALERELLALVWDRWAAIQE